MHIPTLPNHPMRSSRHGVRRRELLLTLGGGALGAAPAAMADDERDRSDQFGRLFRLPTFAAPSPQIEAALMEIGRPGGLMDARDALERGPVALIVDPALSTNNRDSPLHTAGVTFVGQFMDHDMTFDASSRLGQATAPGRVHNSRVPNFDLDSVYGRGPVVDAHMYDGADAIKLRLESGGRFEDLPRRADGAAIIGDPRNDQHVILGGLHAAFMRFHNRAVDRVRVEQPRAEPGEVFEAARRLTTWHYQWMIVNEFLPAFVGPAMVADILRRGRRFYSPREADEMFMPVEFQGAAFRFGHSAVRPSYRANLAGDKGQPFFGFIFDPSQAGLADPADLSGGCRAPRRFVGWQTFFNFGDGNARPNKRIDTRLSTPLFKLPRRAIAGSGGPVVLPQRNLLRHLTWQMPSGQSIAHAMAVPALSRADLDELAPFRLGLEASTPLWYYVLKEADLVADGRHLGPVGGRIVGEVILGLLQADRQSYLGAQPSWRPTLPAVGGDGRSFRMTDFLRFAEVDPISRGQ